MPTKARSRVTPSTEDHLDGPSPVSNWKKGNPVVELPSGERIKIRKLGFQAFMKAGLVPNSLMATVQKAIDTGNADDVDLENADMSEMLEMMDNVVCFIAVEPVVHKAPKTDKDRDPELLYVDEVDDQDKMYLFQYVQGGVRDVEQFRREQNNGVAAL